VVMSIPPGERAGVSERVQHQARAAQLRAAKSATGRNNSVVNGLRTCAPRRHRQTRTRRRRCAGNRRCDCDVSGGLWVDCLV